MSDFIKDCQTLLQENGDFEVVDAVNDSVMVHFSEANNNFEAAFVVE